MSITIFHFLNLVSIIFIMWLVSVLTHFIAGSNQSFLKSHLSSLWYWKIKYVRDYYSFYIHHNIYLWSILSRTFLIGVNLVLITSFTHNTIFQRREFSMLLSPALWLSLLILISMCLRLVRKTKEYEQKK